MVEFLIACAGAVAVLLFGVALLIALPLIVVGLALKAVVWVVLLPFRLLALTFGVFTGALAVLAQVAAIALSVILAIFVTVGGLLLIPILPLLLLVALVWALGRSTRRRAAHA